MNRFIQWLLGLSMVALLVGGPIAYGLFLKANIRNFHQVRDGAFTASYRMEYEHWTNAEAMAEMKRCGYSTLDDEWDISTYLEKYRPRWQALSPSPVIDSSD